MSSANDNFDIKKLQEIREFLVPLWIAWGRMRDREVSCAGETMCRFTSVFLSKIMGKGWKMDGGFNERFDIEKMQWVGIAAGFKDASNKFHGHHWLTNGKIIVDLTAAQFGDADIVITQKGDPRYVSNMLPLQLKEAADSVKVTTGAWLKQWQAHRAIQENQYSQSKVKTQKITR